jgi:hypothetical protein
MPNVLIAVPLHTGIHRRTLDCLLQLQHSRVYQSNIVILRGGDEHISDAKTRIAWKYNQARDMLLQGNYDFLLTIEQDIVFEQDALARMLATMEEHCADVGYGLYCLRQPPFYRWNVFPAMDPETFTGQSLSFFPEMARGAWGKVIECDGQGNGFTLIRRRVLERIRYRVEKRGAVGAHSSQDTYFAFDCMDAGIKQVCDLSIICGHIDYQDGRFVTLWPDINEQKMHRQD